MKSITIEVRLLSYTAVTDTIGVMTFATQYVDLNEIVPDAWRVSTVVVNDGRLGSNLIVCNCGTTALRTMISKTSTVYAWEADARAALALVRSMR